MLGGILSLRRREKCLGSRGAPLPPSPGGCGYLQCLSAFQSCVDGVCSEANPPSSDCASCFLFQSVGQTLSVLFLALEQKQSLQSYPRFPSTSPACDWSELKNGKPVLLAACPKVIRDTF